MGAGPEGVQGDVMTFDVFPNRPDLYSIEGIARGLRGFLGMEVGLPVYRAEASGIDFIVDRSVADVRPYAVGGIVRGLEFEDALLRSLVDLQEKLHLTVGRRRKKVAIGIHDMDKVTSPYIYKAVSGCLAILSTALAERGGRIQTVRTKYADRTLETPDLSPRPHSVRLDRANELLGLSLKPGEAVDFLRRMRHDARASGDAISVLSPAYRLDILHEVDLVEDMAIASGYDRYPRGLPHRQTIGESLEANDFAETLRVLLVGYGYQEVMSLTVASTKDAFETPDRVQIRNPLNEDLTTLRSSMLPALINIFRLNKHRELPQRIFEIADVVMEARNVRRIGAASIHHKASFTEAKSLVLSLMRDVGRAANVDPVEDANFIPGRAASIRLDGREIGRFGEIHPRILETYTLAQPVMAFELDVEPLRSSR